jgi:hypothetical protein
MTKFVFCCMCKRFMTKDIQENIEQDDNYCDKCKDLIFYDDCKIIITYKIIDSEGVDTYETEIFPLVKTITVDDTFTMRGIKYIYPTNIKLQENYKIDNIDLCKDKYSIVSAIIMNSLSIPIELK